MQSIVLGNKKGNEIFRKTCYGIVFSKGKLLVVYSEKDKNYSLIGGGVEDGETLVEALKREFVEESGYYVLNADEFICIDCFWKARNGLDRETLAYFYLVETKSNINLPLEEFHKPLWIEFDRAASLIDYPYQKKALEMFKLFNETNSKFDN